MPSNRRSFLVRQLEKFVEQSQLVHQFERGRMDRVAAKIAIEISVFFQHDDVDACACQKKPGHHSGRAAADDDAARANRSAGGQRWEVEGQKLVRRLRPDSAD